MAPPAAAPVAVIDIGSNSGRVVVYDVHPDGHLHILASGRASLRLVRDLKRKKTLGAGAIRRTLEALQDFYAIAAGSGARRTIAVATSAVRDARNGGALLSAVERDLGIRLRILSGSEEAHFGCLGAVRGLPFEDGAMFDVGGGSLQLSLFQARRIGPGWSLPLGSLRLSDRYLTTDPPTAGQRKRLVAHVREEIEALPLVRLAPGSALVGTGGTVRNLAKIDQRRRAYPMSRLHGYQLSRKSVRQIVTLLASRRETRRVAVPGLNDDRADSIVGGGLAVLSVMKLFDADVVHVSGQGVREGLAASLQSERLPAIRAVRQASIAALTGAFREWDPRSANHRADVAGALFGALGFDDGREMREVLLLGARLLDIGRSVDFFDRHEHVADIVLATDLAGFSHREIALLSAVVRSAGDQGTNLDRYGPLLRKDDRAAVERAATLLALSDEIEERCPDRARVTATVRVSGREVRVAVTGLVGWRPRRIGPRFEQTFGRRLVVVAR